MIVANFNTIRVPVCSNAGDMTTCESDLQYCNDAIAAAVLTML